MLLRHSQNRVGQRHAVGAVTAAPFPTDVTPDGLWLYSPVTNFTKSGGGTPAVNDLLASWACSLHSGSTSTATSAGGTEPSYTLSGVRDSGRSAYLTLDAGISLTGAATVLVFGQKTSGQAFNVVGKGGGANAGIVHDTDETLYFANDAGSFVGAAFALVSNTPFLLVVTRDGSNVVKAQATNVAQTTLGTQAGTLTVNNLIARQGNEYSGTGSYFKAIGVYASLLSAAQISTISAWFLANPDYAAGL